MNDLSTSGSEETVTQDGAIGRKRDLGFAIAVLLFAAMIAGVLFYGNWWRKEHLDEAYETRLQKSLQSYQQVVASKNPDRDQVYLLGAEIDVVMRRIADQMNEPEVVWRNFQFLRQHAHRLNSLFSSTPNWNDPTLLSVRLGEIKRRIDGYQGRSDKYLAEVVKSDSTFGSFAKLQQIEDSVVRSGWDQNSLDDLLTQASVVLVDCLARSAQEQEGQPESSQLQPIELQPTELQPAAIQPFGGDSEENTLSDEDVFLRGMAIATWLIGHQDQPEKLAELETLLKDQSGSSAESETLLRLTDSRTEALLAISKLMVSVADDSDERSIQDALKRFDRSYRYNAKDTDGILGQAMAIRFQAATADWPSIVDTIGELSETETVGKQEVAFLRRDSSYAILQLLKSESWLDRIKTQFQIEKGLETAVNLSRYSTDSFEMLMAIGVARGMAAKNALKLDDFPPIDDRVVEAAKASPSSIIAMTTEAISAGIKRDDVQLNDVVASEAMLNVGLIDMLASIATWRLFAEPEPDPAEVKLWMMLMESITLDPEKIRQQKGGSALLALAGWQSQAGDQDSATKTLEAAEPLVGDTQLFIQIEDLINRLEKKTLGKAE
ncbi:hypothetical protein LF1_23700 [Rubripirellula obstinata]|uniref:Uncharacterized protein n=1 Tax=Rubripirellula obstinata TaxID=406547 RepID=A0A5B1CKA3_9BACT|nr:hypothetical protein [Rubripirellula obstinata]KAA1259833.1 hypothetical protein LF1_23700 [Rubripirellula obstinata]